jgi:Tfp pilus assembly protein PilV
MQRLRDEGGLSLLSVMVAVLILGITVVALSSATVQVLRTRTEATVRSVANIIATTYLEDVKTRRIKTLTSEDSVFVNELGHADPSGRFVRRLTVEPGPVTKSRLITVTVSYPAGAKGRGVIELVTIAYEGVEQ